MKKISAMTLVIMILLTVVVFANELSPGEQLKSYGLISGDETGNLLEDQEMTRAELYKTIIILMGKESEVAELTIEDQPFDDVSLNEWYGPYISYAKDTGLTTGVTQDMFEPNDIVDEQTVATLLLRVLGYSPEWEEAIEDAQELGIEAYGNESFKRSDAFKMILESLSVKLKDKEEFLGASLLIEDYIEVPDVVEEEIILDIDMVTSRTNQLIEITLEDDIDSIENIDLSLYKDDELIGFSDVSFAPWSDNKKHLLIKTQESLIPGEIYHLVSGDDTFKIGGLGEDTDEPSIKSLEVTDPETITIEFNESIFIDDLSVKVVEMYGDKENLPIISIEYTADDTVEVVTEGQASATLYKIIVEGAKDLSGNKMDSDNDRTFSGSELPTDEQTIDSITAKDAYTVEVTFAIKYDPNTTFNSDNYLIQERYDDSNELEIDSVEEKIVDDTLDEKTVIINLSNPTKGATLYLLEIKNMETLYGKGVDKDNSSDTFTGKAIDDDEPSDIDVISKSNTTIEVKIIDDSSIIETLDLSLFSIKESYGDKKELKILQVKEVDTDTNIITLLTEAQSESTLYKLTITEGLEDKFGNATDDDLEGTFTGKKIADAIDAMSIVNVSKGKLKVNFNAAYGEGALDISNYMINQGIGYPSKVEAIEDNDNDVYLYVNGLENGELYELTVENIMNSNGVSMDSDGIKAKFGGMYE